jgi:hypothetical protein
MQIQKLIQIVLVIIVFAACKKTSSPNNETEHEAITTVTLVFKQGSNTFFTYVFDDPDGDGGNPPVRKDNIVLAANQSYNVEITLLNKTKTPATDVTPIIVQQATSHEFYFLPTNVNIATVKTDRDSNGFPLGFTSTWNTTTTSNGTLRLKLMHKPLIKGPADNADKGHSDIDISFDARIN